MTKKKKDNNNKKKKKTLRDYRVARNLELHKH